MHFETARRLCKLGSWISYNIDCDRVMNVNVSWSYLILSYPPFGLKEITEVIQAKEYELRQRRQTIKGA